MKSVPRRAKKVRFSSKNNSLPWTIRMGKDTALAKKISDEPTFGTIFQNSTQTLTL